ncbi:related to cytochrome-c mitochondrial import factor CYC2 [Rhynchosporium graminicola]|uniref:Related to cytochrome-c mitochondrial import factor CYC2 n=1 Tax=Rhynchosporium graminicola TaxID=2792576 RepID=A0A1E1KLH9_9HELO|nr:related to cytochrome-c mitochondrial import factor CYC2 [Rhynchosporium commune]
MNCSPLRNICLRPVFKSASTPRSWLASRHVIVLQCQRQFSTTRFQYEQQKALVATEQPKTRFKGKKRIVPALAIFSGLATALYFIASSDSGPSTKIFDPPRFTPFTIVKREEVSPTSIILTLRPQTFVNQPRKILSDPYQSSWEKGTWSVEIKQPQLQIARSYTPLPSNKGDPKGDLRLLIRKEHKGEVSGYLHTLTAGSQIHLRGPHEEFDLPETVTDVIFLAGGTGIAPALQVAYTLFERRQTEGEKPKMHIVWASRKRAECEGGADVRNPNAWEARKTGRIVQELETLQQKYPGQLEVDYLVDEEKTFLDQKRISSLTKASTEVKFGARHTRIDSKLLFISGPDGFINYIAGPKKWEVGKEGQGQLGGLLGQMSIRTWKVWKL